MPLTSHPHAQAAFLSGRQGSPEPRDENWPIYPSQPTRSRSPVLPHRAHIALTNVNVAAPVHHPHSDIGGFSLSRADLPGSFPGFPRASQSFSTAPCLCGPPSSLYPESKPSKRCRYAASTGRCRAEIGPRPANGVVWRRRLRCAPDHSCVWGGLGTHALPFAAHATT